MTLHELKNEITDLIFDAAIPSDDHLITAANRALREIFIRRKICKTIHISTRSISPSFYRKMINYEAGSGNMFLPLEGKAFSMRISGLGNYAVIDGDICNVYSFDTGKESKTIKGFIKTGGKIAFYGDTSFTIYDYSVYPTVLSSNERDIPTGGSRVSINIRSLYGDFMSFLEPPKNAWGEFVPNCAMSDGKIEVDSDYTEEIVLTYRRLPEKISNTPTDEIDIPYEYEHLLPLLAASYFLLDADPDKSLYYKETYEQTLADIEKHTYEQVNTKYIDTNGWA